jgi:hypothetical protein
VFNPTSPPYPFVLFTYDSPAGFISGAAETVVPVADLAFANPMNTITEVDFIPVSITHPGDSELDVLQSGASEQFRYYPEGTFTEFGVTPGLPGSQGGSHSMLSVAVPEPASIAMLGVALTAMLSLRRRDKRRGQASLE